MRVRALFAALYPLTQLYQFDEDARRGDRTFACVLGMRRSLTVALVAVTVAFAVFAAGALASGWGIADGDRLRWAGLLLAFMAWTIVLVPWRLRHDRLSPAEHQRGMYRALGAWAVTDLVAVLAWGS